VGARAALLAVLAAIGCGDGEHGQGSHDDARHGPDEPVDRGAEAVARVGPGRAQDDALVATSGCITCHFDVAASWRASRHAQSFTNDAFARSYAVEPRAECRACHAPEALPGAVEHDGREELGVTCITCHFVDGVVLAAPGESRERPPHPILRTEAFASQAACGGCHQFPIPGGDPERPEHLAQTTLDELAESGRGESCVDCHMPVVEGAAGSFRSHALASTRDPEAWRRAFSIVAARPAPRVIEVTLRLHDVGHRLPTGDLLRRIRVRADAIGDDHAVVATAEAFLGRQLATVEGSELIVDDTRPAPGPGGRTVRLELPAAGADLPVDVVVVYERVVFGRVEHPGAVLDGSIELARIAVAAREGGP
jgi:hypothetical protein